MNVVIRRMMLEDVPAVHALDMLSFKLPWPERSFRFEVSENAAGRCWVATAEVYGVPRIIAMLVLWLVLDEAHIATVAVHPDFRRCGIGNRIVLESLAAAYAEGARRAFLEVREGNTNAQEMYHKFGFKATGRRLHYYLDTNEDAILMTLDLRDVLFGQKYSVSSEGGVCGCC